MITPSPVEARCSASASTCRGARSTAVGSDTRSFSRRKAAPLTCRAPRSRQGAALPQALLRLRHPRLSAERFVLPDQALYLRVHLCLVVVVVLLQGRFDRWFSGIPPCL